MQNARRAVSGSVLAVGCAILVIAASGWSGKASASVPPVQPNSLSCQAVAWTNAVNVTGIGNTIQKTGGLPSTWDAGAISTLAIQSGDGSVQVTVDSLNTYRMFGLANGDNNVRFTDIDYALYMAGSTLKVYEMGLYRLTYPGTLVVGDVVTVAVESGVVKYYVNGNLIYIGSGTPTYPLLVDTSINSSLGQIANTILCGTLLGSNATFTPTITPTATNTPPPGCQIVSWTNQVNVTASSNTIQKTAGLAATWDTGAISTLAIQSGDGYVEATVDALTTYRMFGLSNGDTNPSLRDIDYAAYMAGPNFMIYERGLYKGVFGVLNVGDVIRVAVVGGTVQYYLNGALVFTSSAMPLYPLLIDTSINSSLGRIYNMLICGANLGPHSVPTFTPTITRTPTVTNTATSTYTPTNSNTPTLTNTPTNTPTNSPTWTPQNTATSTNTPTASKTSTRVPSNTLTYTRTSTPVGSTPTNTPGAGGNCPYFPADNIWNRNISSLPVHPLSDAYIANISLSAPLHASFGSGLWDGGPIGEPFIFVPGTQPRVPVSFQWPRESDPGPYPIPTNAPIEGGPNSTGDRHVLVVDRDNCVSYEMYHSYPHADGSWDAGAGAMYQLSSNALRPNGWTSADAAGLPILPSLVTYDQVQSGVIRHALRFTAPTTQAAHIWPARHHSQTNTDPNLPPMGLRVRLKASTNISAFPQDMRVILQAMKDYGMILADNGDPWDVDGNPDARWNDDVLWLLGSLHGSDFEAIDESSLMIDPNSGQSR